MSCFGWVFLYPWCSDGLLYAIGKAPGIAPKEDAKQLLPLPPVSQSCSLVHNHLNVTKGLMISIYNVAPLGHCSSPFFPVSYGPAIIIGQKRMRGSTSCVSFSKENPCRGWHQRSGRFLALGPFSWVICDWLGKPVNIHMWKKAWDNLELRANLDN